MKQNSNNKIFLSSQLLTEILFHFLANVNSRLNLASCKQRHTIARDASFLMPKILAKFQRDHTQRERQIEVG